MRAQVGAQLRSRGARAARARSPNHRGGAGRGRFSWDRRPRLRMRFRSMGHLRPNRACSVAWAMDSNSWRRSARLHSSALRLTSPEQVKRAGLDW